LNSAVYSCFGIFFTSRPSSLDANHRPLEDEKRRAAHLVRHNRAWLAGLMLLAVVALGAWQWRDLPPGWVPTGHGAHPVDAAGRGTDHAGNGDPDDD
jgi:hypothetical protein